MNASFSDQWETHMQSANHIMDIGESIAFISADTDFSRKLNTFVDPFYSVI